ncbi:MAG: hypothetical protein U0325_25660 [Polyangiales bacterium]
MPHALCPCPGCQRHIRVHDARCPFCDARVALAPPEPPALPRTSRALLLAAGAAWALGGCDAPWISEAHADPMEEPVSMAPQYGAPPEWYESPRQRPQRDAGAPADVSPPPPPVRDRPR